MTHILKRPSLLITLALCLILPRIASAQTVDYTLPNGLQVIVIENHRAPVVSMMTWIKAGSAVEQAGEYGVAHVLEHMLFKGTAKRGPGEIAQAVERSGGDINAYTSFDETVYFLNISSRYAETGLDVLSDMVFNAAIDPEEYSREKEVVLEELRRGLDSPGQQLSRTMFETAFNVHPYGRPVIGFLDSLRNLSRQAAYDFYKRWYDPANMILVVAGDVNSDTLQPVIERYFGQGQASPVPNVERPAEPPQSHARAKIVPFDVKTAQLRLAFHIPGFKSNDSHALDLLSEILGGGRASRLHQNIERKLPFVFQTGTGSYTPEDPGLFLFSADMDPDRVLDTVKAIATEIALVLKDGVSQEELDRARLNVKAGFIRSRATMSGEARLAANFQAMTGDYRDVNKYLDALDAVVPDDIPAVAAKYFKPENMTITVLEPEQQGEDLTDAALIGAASDVLTSVATTVKDTGLGAFSSLTLKNGVRLLVKTDRSLPLVSIRAAFLGGLRFETPQTAGISNLVAQVWDRGTKKLSAEDLDREVEDIAGGIGSFSGRNSFGLEAEFLSEFLDRGLKLFADVLIRPAFDPTELELAKPNVLAQIKRSQDQMESRIFRLLAENLYTGHPYSLDTLGTPESVSALTVEDLRKYYEKWARPDNLVLTVVGDVSPSDLKERLESLFSGWTGGGAPFPDVPPFKPWTGLKEVRDEVDRAQTHMALAFPAPGMKSSDRYALEVLDNVLSGQGGRLFLELRDKQSLAYSVTAFYTPGLDLGGFGFYIACDPPKLEQAKAGFRATIKALKTTPITEKELAGAKTNILGGHDIGLQTYAAQASEATFDVLYGLGLDYPKQYVTGIQSVTADDVLRAAKKYLNFNEALEVVVGPSPSKKQVEASPMERPKPRDIPERGHMQPGPSM